MNSFLLLCDVFSFVFWKKLKRQKNLSKLTDLKKKDFLPVPHWRVHPMLVNVANLKSAGVGTGLREAGQGVQGRGKGWACYPFL